MRAAYIYTLPHVSLDCASLTRGMTWLISMSTGTEWGQAVAQLVEALRYMPRGRGFESRWCHWFFNIHNPSGRTMALELT
jgi:hypothetical protein